MNLKKKLKKFFTLSRQHEAGFTLVELIVVIAILGILGGVGAVGYSGYIKNSNKNADIALVGDVIRAVETGVYSFAYPMDEKLQAAENGMQIPLGFVVLSEDGAEVVQSTGDQTMTSTDPCVRSRNTIDVYSVNYKKIDLGFYKIEAYSLEKETLYYCTEHSDPLTKTEISDLKTRLQTEKIYVNGRSASDSAEYYIKGDFKCFECGTDSDTSMKHYAGKKFPATTTYANFALADETNSSLVRMLKDAFGEEYAATTALKYMGWKELGGYSSFYSGGTNLWTKTEELGNKLAPYSGQTILGKQVTTNTYEDAEDLVTSFAEALIDKYPATATQSGAEVFYEQAWKLVDDSTDALVPGSNNNLFYHGYGFGFGEREYYCACRVGYNEAFAAYVESHAHSGHNETECAKEIRNYGEFMLVASLPKLVCRSALKEYSTEGTGELACAACLELYEDYVRTGVSKENALAFYNTMVTVNEAAATASGSALGFFDYYSAYMKEFEGLYDAVDAITATKETAIVITFYYEDGMVKYDITPISANPRN